LISGIENGKIPQFQREFVDGVKGDISP